MQCAIRALMLLHVRNWEGYRTSTATLSFDLRKRRIASPWGCRAPARAAWGRTRTGPAPPSPCAGKRPRRPWPQFNTSQVTTINHNTSLDNNLALNTSFLSPRCWANGCPPWLCRENTQGEADTLLWYYLTHCFDFERGRPLFSWVDQSPCLKSSLTWSAAWSRFVRCRGSEKLLL